MIPAAGVAVVAPAAIAWGINDSISNPKRLLNQVGLRTRSLENAVTGKSVKSTAINKFFTRGNKEEEEAISLRIKVQTQEDSARKIGFVGTLKVLKEVITKMLDHHDHHFNRDIPIPQQKLDWEMKMEKLSKRKKELIYIIAHKVFPLQTRTVLPDFIPLFKLREQPQNYTEVYLNFAYPGSTRYHRSENSTFQVGTTLFLNHLINQLVIIERFIREAEEVNDFAPGGAEYKKIAARFKKMQMELKPLPKSGKSRKRRKRRERKALRQKEEKERKKKKKEDFTEEEEDSSWFKNAAYRRGGRKTRKRRKTRRRKRRKGRKTRRKTHK